MAQTGWADEVLGFWFDELGADGWYAEKPAAIDAALRERFGVLYREIAASVPPEASAEPESALAAILVLDQFPRNMFRGEAGAFASDAQAAALSRHAVENGWDTDLPPERRQFLYMPLMHSELLADQERCVNLFEATPELEDEARFAREHRDIVARFGRFPHRNRALGRQSTAAELEFLRVHKGFGQ